jgi:hypothetical protein
MMTEDAGKVRAQQWHREHRAEFVRGKTMNGDLLDEVGMLAAFAQGSPAMPLEIVDYATGVKGSFCISRPVADNPKFTEFWNPSGWAGSGFVFTDRALVESVKRLLEG